jgi:hypothetical protein
LGDRFRLVTNRLWYRIEYLNDGQWVPVHHIEAYACIPPRLTYAEGQQFLQFLQQGGDPFDFKPV